jgi:hypothetical protein
MRDVEIGTEHIRSDNIFQSCGFDIFMLLLIYRLHTIANEQACSLVHVYFM